MNSQVTETVADWRISIFCAALTGYIVDAAQHGGRTAETLVENATEVTKVAIARIEGGALSNQ